MSYCRWSTDDFQCDLYCYESDNGYVTHVASNKIIYKEPLPDTIPFEIDYIDQFMERHKLVMRLHDKADRVPLTLGFDGESFCNDTLEEFLDTLCMLKGAGYRFPQYVIETVLEEINESEVILGEINAVR